MEENIPIGRNYCYYIKSKVGNIMPGPGAFLFGNEEKKEVLDVLESGYLSRYGSEDDPASNIK